VNITRNIRKSNCSLSCTVKGFETRDLCRKRIHMKVSDDCKLAKDEPGSICNPLQCTGDYIIIRILFLSRDLKEQSFENMWSLSSALFTHLRRMSKQWKLKSSIFWVTAPCSPLKVEQGFGETYRLYLQGRRINPTRNQHKGGRKERFLVSCLDYSFAWRWRLYVPPKRLSNFNGLLPSPRRCSSGWGLASWTMSLHSSMRWLTAVLVRDTFLSRSF
jgi:hypothetical protein